MHMSQQIPAGIVPLMTPNIMYKPEEGLELPAVFSLSQNYPNPFNPTTEIRFSLPVASDVRLEVYNISGQKVVTLLAEYLSAGDHTVIWDSRSFDNQPVASGIYFYRINADSFSDTKKMILLK